MCIERAVSRPSRRAPTFTVIRTGWQVVGGAERVPRQKWRLGARADVKPAALIQPSDSAMRFEMRMLHPLRQVGALMDDVCLGKAGFDIADVSVQLRDDVALRIGDPRGSGLVVNDRGAGPHGFFPIEYR